MPDRETKRRALPRTQKAKAVRPSAPLLETRARAILATLVEEVTADPGEDLRLPELPETAAPAAAAVAPAGSGVPAEAVQTIDALATPELAAIARHGGSLEVDGSLYKAAELSLLARNVTEQAHLKILNSGGFTAEELKAIAECKPGQVIFA